MLRIAIEVLPQEGRIVLISRDAPPPSLARSQVNRKMGVLGWDDLALTEEETGELVRHLTGLPSPLENVRILHATTRGWAAGTVLMLEHPEGMEPPLSDDIPDQRLLFEYFAGEIFQRMDPTHQSVLLKCAFFPEMTVNMAERISGEKAAGHILASLNRRHWFIDCRETEETIYRLHDLFRLFLLFWASETFSQSMLPEIRHNAGEILEETGWIEAAIELYRDAGIWESLVRLLLIQAPEWVRRGSYPTLSDCLEKIPAVYFAQNPWLDYWQGVSRLPFDPARSRESFERAFDSFERSDFSSGLYLSWCGVVESFFNQWDDFTGLDRWISWLDRRLEKNDGFPFPEIETRVALGMFLSLVFRRPDHPHLSGWMERLIVLSRHSLMPHLRVLGLSSVASYLQWIGALSQAKLLIEEFKRSEKPQDAPEILILQRMVTEASYDWLMGDFQAAYAVVEKGLNMGEAQGIHVWNHRLAAQCAYAALSEGRLDKASSCLGKMIATLIPGNRLDVSHHHYLMAWNGLLRRDLRGAWEHTRSALELAVEAGTPYPESLCRLGLAQIQIETGEIALARNEVELALKIACGMKSTGLEFVAHLLESYASFKTDDEEQGRSSLQKAMTLGRMQGFVNFPFWESSMMARLCGESLEAGIEVPYVSDLIIKRNLIPSGDITPIDAWPWRYRVYTLGRFRLLRDGEPVRFSGKIQHKPLELLKLLATGGSRGISRSRAMDALWPDADEGKACHSLETTLYRLRKILDPDALQTEGDRLRFHSRYFWVDLVSFDRVLSRLRSLLDAGNGEPQEMDRLFGKLAELYEGAFLEDAREAWAQAERERITRNWCRHLERLAIYWERLERWEAAANCYRYGLETAPLIETFYLRLIEACEKIGRSAEAEILRRQIESLFS